MKRSRSVPLDESYKELIEGDYRPRVHVDQVNHPPHYKLAGGEAIEITEQFNFCRGNALKYIIRAGKKDPAKEVEDLNKAIWYLDREVKRLLGKLPEGK